MLPAANPAPPAAAPLTPRERLFWEMTKRALQAMHRAAGEFARACTIGVTAIDELLKE